MGVAAILSVTGLLNIWIPDLAQSFDTFCANHRYHVFAARITCMIEVHPKKATHAE